MWFLALLEREKSKIGPSSYKLTEITGPYIYSISWLSQKLGFLLCSPSALGVSENHCLLLSVEDSVFKHQGQSGHHVVLHQGPAFALIHSLTWGQSVPQESLLCFVLAFSSTYIMTQKPLGRSELWCVGGWVLDTPGNYYISQRIYRQCKHLNFLSFFSCSQIPSAFLLPSMTLAVRQSQSFKV